MWYRIHISGAIERVLGSPVDFLVDRNLFHFLARGNWKQSCGRPRCLRVCSIKAMTEKRMCPISTTKYMNLLDIGMQKVGGGRMEFALDSYRKTGLQKSGQERPTAELSIEILN